MPQNPPSTGTLDVETIRRDFPILSREVHGKPLVWLDNAATTQKPQAVIDRVSQFYAHENSNLHRGTHTLAEQAKPFIWTASARDILQKVIHANNRLSSKQNATTTLEQLGGLMGCRRW